MSQQSRQSRSRGRPPKKRARPNSTPRPRNLNESSSNQGSTIFQNLATFLEDTGQLDHPRDKNGIGKEKVELSDVKRFIKLWKHSMELKVNLY